MAAGNWTSEVYDENGEGKRFISPKGVSVCTYKNWLDVEEFVKQEGNYVFPPNTIMQFYDGNINYKDTWIVGTRYTFRDALVFAAWSGHKGIIGIACYGYDNSGKFTSVPKSLYKKVGILVAKLDWELPDNLQEVVISNFTRRYNGN